MAYSEAGVRLGLRSSDGRTGESVSRALVDPKADGDNKSQEESLSARGKNVLAKPDEGKDCCISESRERAEEDCAA